MLLSRSLLAALCAAAVGANGQNSNRPPQDFWVKIISGGKESRQNYVLNDNFDRKNRQVMLGLPIF